jgi:hypothetical protein
MKRQLCGLVYAARIITECQKKLHARLDGRVIELRGEPLPLLRKIMPGGGCQRREMLETIHLRVKAGRTSSVIERLSAEIPSRVGVSRFKWSRPS